MLKISIRTAALAIVAFLLCHCSATTASRSLPTSTLVLGSAEIYVSASGDTLEIVHDPRTGIVIVKRSDGTSIILPEEISGKAGRYRDNRNTLWEHDSGVVLWVDGNVVFSGTTKR
jgi:hypothetical protein